MKRATHICWYATATLWMLACVPCGWSQDVDITARVEITHRNHPAESSGDVVLWLTPLQKAFAAPSPRRLQEYKLAQKDKQFSPHLLVVPTGSNVSFPNLDPFFHNVFSLFNGKRFDLGLYEAHTERTVHFDREGISYIFCNIHPEMGAVIVSLSTPYYGVSARSGTISLRNVPPGSYRLNLWAENVSVEHLNALSRTVEITPQATQLGTFQLQTSGDLRNHHPNKFGESYGPVPRDPY